MASYFKAKEYVSVPFNYCIASHAVIFQSNCFHTPQHNGLAKQKRSDFVDQSSNTLKFRSGLNLIACHRLYWKLRLLSHSSFLRTLLCCPSSSSTYFVMKFLPAVTNCMFEQLCVFLGIPEFKRDIAVILYLQIIFTSLICYFLNKHCPLTYCLFLSLKHLSLLAILQSHRMTELSTFMVETFTPR